MGIGRRHIAQLESMLAEIGKLDAVRAAGLPDGLFSGIAARVIAPTCSASLRGP